MLYGSKVLENAMSKFTRLHLNQIISLFITAFCSSSAAYAEDVIKYEPKARDPFLERMIREVAAHKPSETEMAEIADYVSKHETDSDGHLLLADAYFKLGMDGLYAEELEKAWKLNPKAMMYLIGALKARAISGDTENFDRLVEDCFKTYAHNVNDLNTLATLLQMNKQDALAIKFYKRAMQLDPSNLHILEDYCSSLISLKQYSEAITAAQKLHKNPQFEDHAALVEGLAYFNLNQTKKAIPLLKKAYLAHPNSPLLAQSYYAALMTDGQIKEAVVPALMALAFQPLLSPADLDTVKSNIRPVIRKASPKDIEEGIAAVKKNMQQGRALAYFYFSLGDLLDKENRVRQAIECYTEGLAIDNTFGRAYMRLGTDMALMGASPSITRVFFEQAALRAPSDQQVLSKYFRMKERSKVYDQDIANQLKGRFNQLRFQK